MSSNNKGGRLTDEEFMTLLKKYKETKDVSIRNQLTMAYMYIPQTAAMQLRGLASGYAQIEDMVNQGVMTLMECIDRFDPLKGIKFESYAFMRIRGGIIDLVRKQDWIPRRVRELSKEVMRAYNELANERMCEPTQQEIADRLNIPVEKLGKYNAEIANMVTISFEDLIQNTSQMGEAFDSPLHDEFSPEKSLLKSELREVMKGAIDELSERERLIVTLHYYENLTLADIAKVIDVSPQRVSQIHTKAMLKLKMRIDAYTNEK